MVSALRRCLSFFVGFLFLALTGGALASDSSRGSMETSTRFLEYDASRNQLVYEVSLRNVGFLPVSYIELESNPPCTEGPFHVDELTSGDIATRRFSFQLPPGQRIFQPRYNLAFTDYEGERIRNEEERSPLSTNMDFSYCDVNTGWVDLLLSVTNLGDEPLLFLELRSENPRLPQGVIRKESLSPGDSYSWVLEFQLEPGETLFNPTLYLDYFSFSVNGTRLQKKFFTLLHEDLRIVENALAKPAGNPAH